MFCQKCGTELNQNDGVCPTCGTLMPGKKFCQHCGQVIDTDCVICPKCGKQVSRLKSNQAQPQIVINNSNSNANANANANTNTNSNANVNTNANINVSVGRPKNKWVALLLCLFLGFFGIHKFYEEKVGMGILYLITGGLFFVGWIVDLLILLTKPNPYFV